MTRKRKHELTQVQFDALRPLLTKRWEPHNIEAAYRMMVLGHAPTLLAQETKLSRQHLHRVVRDVYDAYLEHKNEIDVAMVPDDWVSVSVLLPHEMAEVVEQMALAAREKLAKKTAHGG